MVLQLGRRLDLVVPSVAACVVVPPAGLALLGAWGLELSSNLVSI